MPSKLQTKTCEEIMETPYAPMDYIIDGLLASGLYILAGAPKVGKSWLALDMCLNVARGESVLGRETHSGEVLFLCLEDNYTRIQNRIYELTDEPTEKLFFSIMSDSIGDGLEAQLAQFKSEHDNLKLVVIDTLQKVRDGTETGYGNDYKELSLLKSLADQLKLAIIVVHHTRKCRDGDPFNMISGSTGLTGCVDGSIFSANRSAR